jgi:chromosome segregation ATPase
MSKAELEKTIADTAKAVEGWQSNIKKIESQIANAHSRLEKSEAQRKRFALDASLGNAQATAAISAARAEAAAAAGDVNDLGHALSQAKARLIEAEGEAKRARHELGRFEAMCRMRERVKAAARIDAVISEFSAALAEFDKLGRQIANMPGVLASDRLGSTSISQMEEIQGNRRMRSALPQVFLRFFPGALHEERPKMDLEKSEIQTWGSLAPAETTTTKAA